MGRGIAARRLTAGRVVDRRLGTCGWQTAREWPIAVEAAGRVRAARPQGGCGFWRTPRRGPTRPTDTYPPVGTTLTDATGRLVFVAVFDSERRPKLDSAHTPPPSAVICPLPATQRHLLSARSRSSGPSVLSWPQPERATSSPNHVRRSKSRLGACIERARRPFCSAWSSITIEICRASKIRSRSFDRIGREPDSHRPMRSRCTPVLRCSSTAVMPRRESSMSTMVAMLALPTPCLSATRARGVWSGVPRRIKPGVYPSLRPGPPAFMSW